MEYKIIDACIHEIEKILKYSYVRFEKQRKTRFYFDAIDEQQNHHEIWYNSTSNRYFENINGCSIFLKDFLTVSTPKAATHFEQEAVSEQ